MTNYIETFESLGLTLTKANETQYRADCPFCDKAKHLYIISDPEGSSATSDGKKVDGMWNCHFCQEKGNIFTFLKKFTALCQEQTTKDHRIELWEKKSIPPAIAKLCGCTKSILTDQWLIPCYNQKEGVVNISYWAEKDYDEHGDMKGPVYFLKGLETKPLGLQFLSSDLRRPLLVPEGHWDWMIGEHCYRATKRRDSVDILAAPGSGSFKEEWLKYLAGRDLVVLLFDGDHERVVKTRKIQPGLDGMKRIAKMVASMDDAPKQLKFMNWPSGLPNGFDLRDLYRKERGVLHV